METIGDRQNLLRVLDHSTPREINLITCKFDSMSKQCSLWGRRIKKYFTGDWHGHVCRVDGQRLSYQDGRGRAGNSRCHLHDVFSTVAVGHLDQLP